MDMEQSILVGVIGFALAAGLALVVLLHLRQAETIAKLQIHLDVFVDTSINVARSVDRLSISSNDEQGFEQVSSRRWLVEEARERAKQGSELVGIGKTLGLSGDEVRLLRVQASL